MWARGVRSREYVVEESPRWDLTAMRGWGGRKLEGKARKVLDEDHGWLGVPEIQHNRRKIEFWARVLWSHFYVQNK
jgi:hypothetical protein